jgi:hypothetical protein
MLEWEYKVQNIGWYGDGEAPMSLSYHPLQDPSGELQKRLEEFGKEGWELVHVHPIPARWKSNPEAYPGGDAGRMTWEPGLTIVYFKRQGKNLAVK